MVLSWDGCLLDPEDRSVVVFQLQKQPEIYYCGDRVPVLEEIDLNLTVEDIFNWLKMKAA